MGYKISWQESAQDDFKRLDKAVAERIIDKATDHLVKDPIAPGPPSLEISGDCIGIGLGITG